MLHLRSSSFTTLRAARRNVNGSLKKPVKLRLSLGISVHGTPRLPTRYPNHQPPRSFESPTARRATAARPNDDAINLNLQKTPSRSFSAKLAAITSSGGRKTVKDTEGSPDKKEQDTEREIEPPKFVFPIRKKEEKEIVAPLDTDE